MATSFDGNTYYWAQFKNTDATISYTIRIKKYHYTSGTNYEIVNMAPSPLIYKHTDVEDSNIQASQMVFSFYIDKSDIDEYELLVTSSEYTYLFQLFDQRQLNEPMWEGFIMPSDNTRNYFENKILFKITASDGLANLKKYAFSDVVGHIPITRKKAIDLITLSLYKIGNISRSFTIQTGIEEASMTGTAPGIAKCYVHPSNFTRKRNGLIVPDNCYTIVDNVLKAFNSRLCRPLMSYQMLSYRYSEDIWILNADEIESPLWYCADTTEKGDGYLDAFNLEGAISSALNIDSYYFLPGAELTRKMPIKSLELIQHNYDNGVIVDAVDFNDADNASIWTLSNISVSQSGEINTFTLQELTTGTITTTNAYLLENTNGNAYIRVGFSLKNTSSTIIDLIICVKIINITLGETETDYLPYFSLYWAYDYRSASDPRFKIKDNCEYKIQISVTNASLTNDMTFELSHIVVSKYYAINGESSDDVLFDYLFEAYSDSAVIPEKTIETRMGDSDIVSNKSSITYSTSNDDLTSSWSRYGKIESKSLQEILLQSYFNRFGGYNKVINIQVYDPNNTISLIKKIQFDGNTYNILDIERDIIKGIVSLRMQQISTTDIPITIISKYIANNSVSGSSSASVSSGSGSNTGISLDNRYALRNALIISISTNTTIDSSYNGAIVECTNTITITLPNSMPKGFRVDIVNIGTGTITIAASTTLQSDSSKTKLATKYTGASCYHRGSNVWLVVGKLTS